MSKLRGGEDSVEADWMSGFAKGGTAQAPTPLRFHKSDPRSLLAKLPVSYYKRKQRTQKYATFDAEALNGPLADLSSNIAIFPHAPHPIDGSKSINADVLDFLMRPVQGWATVGYGEIGRLPSGKGSFARRAIAADYPQQAIYVLGGQALDEVVVKLKFADISCTTAYSKVFGSIGFTIHCLQTGIELMVMPDGIEGHTTQRWLSMLDLSGCHVHEDKSREDVNDLYLKELKDERAKLDALEGIDMCRENSATLLPCSLCCKRSYVCDVTGLFHVDALRRLATIDRQQKLQAKKSLVQQFEDDFATTDEDEDELLGPVKLHPNGLRTSSPPKPIQAHPTSRLGTWLLSSLIPETHKLPCPLGQGYIRSTVDNAMAVAALAERSLRTYEKLFHTTVHADGL
eukprot:GILI01018310.1.p1 GENE.GILI01018310.1~~GILI01018310.1.p1  ORF type:complete len:436 (+),score=65.33 GILI01018310.1:109-1308(+)